MTAVADVITGRVRLLAVRPFDAMVAGAGPAGSTCAYHLSRAGARVLRALGPLAAASWRAKIALDRHPRLSFARCRLPPLWWPVVRLVRGEIGQPLAGHKGFGRVPLEMLQALGHETGNHRRQRPAAVPRTA